MKNSVLTVSIPAIKSNFIEIINEIGPNCKCVPVLKANAYGFGLETVARALLDTGLTDTIAVSHVAEGLELRKITDCKIWVISAPIDFQLKEAVENNLTLTVARTGVLPQINRYGKADVQIKIETGLNRIGVKPGPELDEILDELCSCENVSLTGMFSHFSTDIHERMEQQYSVFLKAVSQAEARGFSGFLKHMAGSASVETTEAYNLDAVRVGRRLYMDSPVRPTGKIHEVCSYHSFLTAVYDRKCGEPLGYNDSYILSRDTKVGVIGVGYGDGYPAILFNNHAPVIINGKHCRLLTCCMDQSFVDLTDTDAAPGDKVLFFGDGLTSQEVASYMNDEGCTITSNLTDRVERIYI